MVPNTVRVAVGILGTPHLHVLSKPFVSMNMAVKPTSLCCRRCCYYAPLCNTNVRVIFRNSTIYAWSEIDTTYAIILLKPYALQLCVSQIDIQKGHKEGQCRGVLMRALHTSSVQLPPLHLVWASCSELRMGEHDSIYHQWIGHTAWDRIHQHICMVCTKREEGKWSRSTVHYPLSHVSILCKLLREYC